MKLFRRQKKTTSNQGVQQEIVEQPFEVMLLEFLGNSKRQPFSVETINEIRSSSVERAKDSNPDALLNSWIDISVRSAALTLVGWLREPERWYASEVSQKCVQRAISVVAAIFAQLYVRSFSIGVNESIRVAIDSIDSFGESFLDWSMHQNDQTVT